MTDQNRETKEFSSKGHVIVAYPYLTAPEVRETRKALFAGIAVQMPEPGQSVERPKIPMDNTLQFQRIQLEKAIVTIDGKPPFEVLDLIASDEYDEMVADITDQLPRVFLAKPKTPATPSGSSSS